MAENQRSNRSRKEAVTYLRFTLLGTDPDSNRKQGILVAAHELRDNGDLTVAGHRELREVLEWFDMEVHKARDPGFILYEDGWQVVAKPRRGLREGW